MCYVPKMVCFVRVTAGYVAGGVLNAWLWRSAENCRTGVVIWPEPNYRAVIYCSNMMEMEKKSSSLSALESKTCKNAIWASTEGIVPTSD